MRWNSTRFSMPTGSPPTVAIQVTRRPASAAYHCATSRSNAPPSAIGPASSSTQARRSAASAPTSAALARRTLPPFTPFISHGGLSSRRERQQGPAGRADLDVGTHRGAHAAVEAGRPPAVVLLELGERVLPVVPEPLLVQPRVEVVPGQHLVGIPLTRRVPVEVDPRRNAGPRPALEREVL